MADVELLGVSKRFGKVTAVDNLSLTIPDRMFVTLLGPSGCGKTTTLNLIAGLEDIDGGEIHVDGLDITSRPPHKRDMAMVFQSYALYPHMTAFENIAFGLRLAKMPSDQIRRRVEEVAQTLEITHLLGRLPKELSGGQRQRVALGRALSRSPKVFLMDEPLSNLDAKLRVRMRFEIRRLHLEQESTTIYVTHDQAEAMTMSDRIAVMKSGALQQYGSPGEVYNHPTNLFVAGFVGSPAMNLIPGEWRAVNGEAILRSETADLYLPPEIGLALRAVSAPPHIVLGIRPEDVETTDESGQSSVRGGILVVEQLGADDYLHVDLGGFDLMMRVPAGQGYKRGDTVSLHFRRRGIHIFDARTEERIECDATPAGQVKP